MDQPSTSSPPVHLGILLILKSNFKPRISALPWKWAVKVWVRNHTSTAPFASCRIGVSQPSSAIRPPGAGAGGPGSAAEKQKRQDEKNAATMMLDGVAQQANTSAERKLNGARRASLKGDFVGPHMQTPPGPAGPLRV